MSVKPSPSSSASRSRTASARRSDSSSLWACEPLPSVWPTTVTSPDPGFSRRVRAVRRMVSAASAVGSAASTSNIRSACREMVSVSPDRVVDDSGVSTKLSMPWRNRDTSIPGSGTFSG